MHSEVFSVALISYQRNARNELLCDGIGKFQPASQMNKTLGKPHKIPNGGPNEGNTFFLNEKYRE